MQQQEMINGVIDHKATRVTGALCTSPQCRQWLSVKPDQVAPLCRKDYVLSRDGSRERRQPVVRGLTPHVERQTRNR